MGGAIPLTNIFDMWFEPDVLEGRMVPQEVIDEAMLRCPEMVWGSKAVGGRHECNCWEVVGRKKAGIIFGMQAFRDVCVFMKNPECTNPQHVDRP